MAKDKRRATVEAFKSDLTFIAEHGDNDKASFADKEYYQFVQALRTLLRYGYINREEWADICEHRTALEERFGETI